MTTTIEWPENSLSWPAAPSAAGPVLANQTVDENTVGVGGLLCLKSDGHWEDASNDADADMPCAGLAMDGGTGGGKRVLLWGLYTKASWSWTKGAALYVSTNGGLTATVPTGTDVHAQKVALALTTTTIVFYGFMAADIKRVS